MNKSKVENLLITLINLGILGICVKIYTEILKDKKFDVREHRGSSLPGSPGKMPPPPSEPTWTGP